MTFIEEIANYIENNTDYKVGKDIFIGEQPSRIDKVNVIAIYETGSREPRGYYPHYLPGIQVYIRASDYGTASTMADNVFDVLHRTFNENLSSKYIYYLLATASPQHIGKDENGRDEFSINFNSHIR